MLPEVMYESHTHHDMQDGQEQRRHGPQLQGNLLEWSSEVVRTPLGPQMVGSHQSEYEVAQAHLKFDDNSAILFVFSHYKTDK